MNFDKWDAERFHKFRSELHLDKTRLLELGLLATERRSRGRSETFIFLGFTHACEKKRKGPCTVPRRTIRTRLHAKLNAVKGELWRRWHDPIPATRQRLWLGNDSRGCQRLARIRRSCEVHHRTACQHPIRRQAGHTPLRNPVRDSRHRAQHCFGRLASSTMPRSFSGTLSTFNAFAAQTVWQSPHPSHRPVSKE